MSFKQNLITEKGAECLFKFFYDSQKYEKKQQINQSTLAKFKGSKSKLKKLNLSYNLISSLEERGPVEEELIREELYDIWDRFIDPFGKVFCQFLENNYWMESINLSNNQLTGTFASQLVDCFFSSNFTLEDLDL